MSPCTGLLLRVVCDLPLLAGVNAFKTLNNEALLVVRIKDVSNISLILSSLHPALVLLAPQCLCFSLLLLFFYLPFRLEFQSGELVLEMIWGAAQAKP